MPPRPPEPVPEDMDAIVEDACRFIEECRRRHARALGMRVGEYLYLHVYRMNDEYIASHAPDKDMSMLDMAARTGYGKTILRTWVVAAAARHRLAGMGFESEDTSVRGFAALYRLMDHPKVALELARWSERERVTADALEEWAGVWAGVVAEGGSLEKLRSMLPPDPPRRDPKRRRRGRQLPPDELRVVRVLEMVLGWIREARFSPARRSEIQAAVREVGRALS